MIKVKSYKELSEITDCENGETGYVEIQDNKFKPFVYDANKKEWKPKTGKTGLNLTNYDLNRQQIEKLPDYDWENQKKEAKDKINNFISKYSDSKYFMFLCHDIRYYTMFHRTPEDTELKSMADEMVNILQSSTAIKVKCIDVYQMESTQTWVCEIWLKTEAGLFVAYMFPYDGGVIECS